MISEQPQFLYWSRTMELQLTILKLVKSIREANFQQYVNSLKMLMPWYFSMNRLNYARWLSVHIRDICKLEEMHPGVFQQFTESVAFTVKKTSQPFYTISLTKHMSR